MNLKLNWLYRTYLDHVGTITGNDPEVLHSLMGDIYLSKRKRITIGKKIRYTRIKTSTTKLTDEQFSEYFDKVQNYFDIDLPNRDDPEFHSIR